MCVCVIITHRLEQSCVLTELLKRFQSIRAELNGMLQRAESTIGEQASYMGKDNVQKLHTKVYNTLLTLILNKLCECACILTVIVCVH